MTRRWLERGHRADGCDSRKRVTEKESAMCRLVTALTIALSVSSVLGADRVTGFRKGMKVTQKRGVVCISNDFAIYGDPSRGADHCWIPNPEISVGKVVEVEDAHVIVEYPTDLGWQKHTVSQESVWILMGRDYRGDPVFYRWRKDKVEFDRADTALLLSGEENGRPKSPIRVRCPLNTISVPPPSIGDVVVRGPDWNKGTADGEAGWKGRIVQSAPDDPNARSRDGYVTVEWEATKRRGRYRWDYHRKFDVISVGDDTSE